MVPGRDAPERLAPDRIDRPGAGSTASAERAHSEVARICDLTRAAARRFLLTLADLGYVRSDGRLFSLTPRVL